jgi:hypothetical protein
MWSKTVEGMLLSRHFELEMIFVSRDDVLEDSRTRSIHSRITPHPLAMANWPSYWSLMDPSGGKQTGEIVLVNLMGDSSVRMAISLF